MRFRRAPRLSVVVAAVFVLATGTACDDSINYGDPSPFEDWPGPLKANAEIVYPVANESMAVIDAAPMPDIQTLTIPGMWVGTCIAGLGGADVDSADVDTILERWHTLDWRVETRDDPPGWPEIEHILFVGDAGTGTMALNTLGEWQIWWTTWCVEPQQ